MCIVHTDFRLIGARSDSIFKLVPLTDSAKAWIEEKVSKEGYQPEWPVLYVERRYIDPLLDGIGKDGLTVDFAERASAI